MSSSSVGCLKLLSVNDECVGGCVLNIIVLVTIFKATIPVLPSPTDSVSCHLCATIVVIGKIYIYMHLHVYRDICYVLIFVSLLRASCSR